MRFVVPLTILLYVILTSIPLVVGINSTPAGHTYLGVTHHAPDYFYYLSQFAQGHERLFTSFDLYTSDYPVLTLVGWVNVLLGTIGKLFFLPPTWTYHLAVFVSTILFLLLAYTLIERTLTNVSARILAFVFFVFANGYPIVHWSKDTLSVDYPSYWFNLTEPLNRTPAVPHQLLMNCAILAIFISSSKLWDSTTQPKMRLVLPLLLCSFVLASTNPAQWAIITLVICSVSAWHMLRTKSFHLFPTLIGYIAVGLPMILHLQGLFADFPYSQIRAWEAVQHVLFTPWDFIKTHGPLFLIAVAGLPLFIRTKRITATALLLYAALSLVVFLTPIPQWLVISNIRATSPLLILVYALVAASFVQPFIEKKKRIFWLVIGVFLIVSLPVMGKQVSDRSTYNTNNAYYFIPNDIVALFRKAQEVSTVSDTFYVSWPFNISFPGMTGRRSYHGHPLLTINPDHKNDQAWLFVSHQMSQIQAASFIADNGITFVIGPSTLPIWYPTIDLTSVFDASLVSLYRVTQ